ncbi:MAG: hypothetical protein P8176_05085 [Gammaproteobacteria bacterium]
MPLDQIRTDSSDVLSQRLLAHGYTIEPDFYPHTQIVAANRVAINGLLISYRVEPSGELFLTYLESQPSLEGEFAVFHHPMNAEQVARAEAALARVGLSQAARGLGVFLNFVIVHVPEIKQGKALLFCLVGTDRAEQKWCWRQDYRQRVTTERIRAFLFKWYGQGLTETGRDEQGGVWLACDFQRLRHMKRRLPFNRVNRAGQIQSQ